MPPLAKPGHTAPPPQASPDGSVTYTAADTGPARQVYGSGPKPGPSAAGAPPLQSSTLRTGSYGSTPRKSGMFGWLLRGFGLRIAIGAVVLLVGGGIALFSDSVSVGRLEPGDCFGVLTETEISNVTEQDCALPHGGEVYATVTGSPAGLGARCSAAFDQGLAAGTIVLTAFPDDALFSYLQGEDEHHCLIESPSGQLVGQFVRR